MGGTLAVFDGQWRARCPVEWAPTGVNSMRCVAALVCVATLLANASAQSQQIDVLRQLVGLWTAEWVAEGRSKVEQVQFNRNALNRHTAALPFLPGLATITLCQGQGCAGADISVSGTGFDCLYAYSVYNRRNFAWTYKGGNGGCPPSAKFRKDPALR
jgi:hypothetical protein